MPSKSKKSKRSEHKYSSLDKTYNLKTRSDLFDQDYINGYHDEETGISIRSLNNKEKDWLNRFNSEYINADFRKKRVSKKIKKEHPKNVNLKKLNKILNDYLKEMNEKVNNSNISLKSSTNLRKIISKFKVQLKKKIQKELKYVKDYYKKQSEDSNNARNRCVLTRAKAQGKTLGIDYLPENFTLDNDVEEDLINNLDLAKQFKNGEN
jgi:hypothetical protein